MSAAAEGASGRALASAPGTAATSGPRAALGRLERAVALSDNVVFISGWLNDPGGLIEAASVRVGPRSSGDLLEVLTGRGQRASSLTEPSEPVPFAARVRLHKEPSLAARDEPPAGQLELVLSERGGACQRLRARLAGRVSLDARTEELLAKVPPAAASREAAPGATPLGLLSLILGLWLALWRWLRMEQRAEELLPGGDVFMLDRAGGRWLAVGSDPKFRLKRRLPAGYYMLEVELVLPRARNRARLYIDSGGGETETGSLPLLVRDGRLSKRVVWLERRARLRFDPMEVEGAFRIRHFRLTRIPGPFAAGRMRRKLRGAHPGGIPADLRGAELYEQYSRLFEQDAVGGLSYRDWIAAVEAPSLPDPAEQAAAIAAWSQRPLISIITPTYNTPLPVLRACAESVLAQSYPHWEWCIADDASTESGVRALLEELAARDARIRVAYRETNGHIAAASNTALSLASGEYVALLDHDDVLPAHALFHVVEAVQRTPEALLLYSDEDKLDVDDTRCEPFFKPDWSPELLLGENYINHLTVYRRTLLNEVGGFRPGFEGSQDYDLLLRCSARIERREQVVHIPRVLYHWRKAAGSTAAEAGEKSYATEAAVGALREHMTGRKDASASVSVLAPGRYRQRWPLPEPAPLVSLLIPTRDGHALLSRCLRSVLERTSYPSFEILIIDNQSTCPDTLRYMAELEVDPVAHVRVVRHDAPFNFAALNNHGAREARGSVLLLLNNDIEVIGEEWLTELVSHCMRPHVGCVGAKLYYPDDTIQHAGVVLGIGGVAGHSHKYLPRSSGGYFGRLTVTHEVSAVTGAALAVRKEVYEQVGGMDEGLAVAFNDVDFCLKVGRAGFTNLFTPFAELYHHESRSRGAEDTDEKKARFARERALMRARWGDLLERDPYYNPNLSRTREDYSLSTPLELE